MTANGCPIIPQFIIQPTNVCPMITQPANVCPMITQPANGCAMDNYTLREEPKEEEPKENEIKDFLSIAIFGFPGAF